MAARGRGLHLYFPTRPDVAFLRAPPSPIKCGIVGRTAAGDTPAMIYRARHVVPLVGPPIENGAVAVTGDTIAAVGPWDGIRPAWAGEAGG